MTISANKLISVVDLKELHSDLFQWALFCSEFDPETAHDLIQQTYLKIFEGKAIFNGGSSLKTWLFGVTKLTHMEIIRKHSLRDQDSTDHETEEALGPDEPSASMSFPDESDLAIAAAMKSLSLMQREIIYLHFYKDMTLSEVALTLNTTTGTISSQYDRAKKKLNSLLTSWSPLCETN